MAWRHIYADNFAGHFHTESCRANLPGRQLNCEIDRGPKRWQIMRQDKCTALADVTAVALTFAKP